jgi:hypothetical protein
LQKKNNQNSKTKNKPSPIPTSEAEALYPPDQPQAYESASLVGIGDGLFLVFEFWLFFFCNFGLHFFVWRVHFAF